MISLELLVDEIKDIEKLLIESRRYIHKHAELGYDTKNTSNYIKSILNKYDIEYNTIDETGIYLDLGNGEDGALLRADIDALPMKEENDLSFKSITDASHCCGHDLHAAIMLGVAIILKRYEDKLTNRIRIVFQPDEEGGEGMDRMIKKGLLDNTNFKEAIGIHVDAKSPLGLLSYGLGQTFASSNDFQIKVHGKGGHGARAYETVDPISISVDLYNNFMHVLNRELDPFDPILFSITSIDGKSSSNIILDSIEMMGTLRTYNEDINESLVNRLRDITEKTCSMFGGKGEFNLIKNIPSLTTSEELTMNILEKSKDLNDYITIADTNVMKRGSEDFAFISEHIDNTAYLFIGAGKNTEQGYEYGQHNKKVIFNEDAISLGTLIISHYILNK